MVLLSNLSVRIKKIFNDLIVSEYRVVVTYYFAGPKWLRQAEPCRKIINFCGEFNQTSGSHNYVWLPSLNHNLEFLATLEKCVYTLSIGDEGGSPTLYTCGSNSYCCD